MDAKQIALLMGQVADLVLSGEVTLEMNENFNAALWELATLKDIREEVDAILQYETQAKFDEGYNSQKPTQWSFLRMIAV
jgi:hypothetical protein